MKKTLNPKIASAAIRKIETRKPKTNATVKKPANKVPISACASQEKTIRQSSKLGIIVNLLKSAKGATVIELTEATGWQKHSIHGAMSGALKRKLGMKILSEKEPHGRVYRIA